MLPPSAHILFSITDFSLFGKRKKDIEGNTKKQVIATPVFGLAHNDLPLGNAS